MPERGRFRAFLLMAVKRFLDNERRREHAQKRGGGGAFTPLDADAAESRHAIDPAPTPDQTYERLWALQLLEHALVPPRPASLDDELRHFMKILGLGV